LNANVQLTQVEQLKIERERMADALDHIMRTCRGSRTQTRRIRFLGLRAECALEGRDDWRDAEIPRNDPLVEKLRSIIVAVYPFVKGEFAGLVDSYSSLSAKEREQATWEAILASIEPEHEIALECVALRKFLIDARRNVPELNVQELGAGAPWLELQS
jgi:hypothetical protein